MIQLSQPQMEFLQDGSPISIACSGRGSGKSYVGATWAIQRISEEPWVTGLVGASNPAQLHSVAVKQLVEILDGEGIEWIIGKPPPWFESRYQRHVNILSVENGAQVVLRSFHEGGANRNLRGLNLGWAWLDESRELEESVFDLVLAALRDRDGTNRIRLTTTPNGRDWQWRRLIKHPEIATCHRWTSESNSHLPDGWVNYMKSIMDEDLYRQEIGAEIVDFDAGQAYRFTHGRNIAPFVNDGKWDVTFALDLNVQPMCGVLVATRDGMAHVFDEIYIRTDASTRRAAELALEKVSRFPCREVRYLCDESGAARSTRTPQNDIDIMRSAFSAIPSRCLNGSGKPGVVESVQQVNGMLSPVSGKPLLLVDPCCRRTIDDLEGVKWAEGEPRRLDKSDPQRSHFTDALRYCCWATCRNARMAAFNIGAVRTYKADQLVGTNGEQAW